MFVHYFFIFTLFVKVNTKDQFWKWASDTLIPGLYGHQYYNGLDAHWRQRYFISDFSYFRIGNPRFRLARVKGGNYKCVYIVIYNARV